jgi:TRAP transporter TAXI family solute receptor
LAPPGVPHDQIRALFPMYQTGTSAAYWPRYFETAGMDVTLSYAGVADTAGQLKDGLIDAFVYAAGLPTGAYSQLAVEYVVRFLSMSEEELALMTEAVPSMQPFTIPANTYEDQPEDVQTVSLWNFAIAGASMPDSLAYAITRAGDGEP